MGPTLAIPHMDRRKFSLGRPRVLVGPLVYLLLFFLYFISLSWIGLFFTLDSMRQERSWFFWKLPLNESKRVWRPGVCWLWLSCHLNFEHISSVCKKSSNFRTVFRQFLGIFLALSVKIIWMEQEKCGPPILDVQHVWAPTCMCVWPNCFIASSFSSIFTAGPDFDLLCLWVGPGQESWC